MCIRSESVKRSAAVREVVYPKTDRACAVRRPYVRVGELVRSGDSEHRRSFSLAPFSFPRPFLSLDRVLRILSLGRRRRRLREFLALILSQSPTLPPPLKGPVRMTFLKFCFSPPCTRCTGISSQFGAKLREWAARHAGAGCYSKAALSLNDSKTR